eukprot:c23118_g1_i1 orf=445-1752(-)
MALVLHSTSSNKNGLKALIAAEYNGVKVDLAPNFVMGVSNKTPEYLRLNPIGKVPVLETLDGPIFESNAIAKYVARLKESSLLGTCIYESALVDQWIDFATTEIDALLRMWVPALMGYFVYIPEVVDFAILGLKRALGTLNNYLSSNTYLVGHFITLADIILTCNLKPGFSVCFTKDFTTEFPHVERYFWTMINQPHFKKYFGEIKQVEKLVYPAAKAQEKKQLPQKKEPAAAKEEPSKKTKGQQKPQEVSPALQDVPPALDDDDEESKPKPKIKNPLDLLPPSSMILDDWKRLYSNTKAKEFREVAIKGFWDKFDSEGYSLWFCDYKYNDENTVPYVTMNKVSGFLQRMDMIRKYGFAKICILGESPPYKIKGVWLFRGKEIPKMVLDECYDVELYDWSKVNTTDEVQIERVNSYFEEPDVIDGEKLLEAKCFK